MGPTRKRGTDVYELLATAADPRTSVRNATGSDPGTHVLCSLCSIDVIRWMDGGLIVRANRNNDLTEVFRNVHRERDYRRL